MSSFISDFFKNTLILFGGIFLLAVFIALTIMYFEILISSLTQTSHSIDGTFSPPIFPIYIGILMLIIPLLGAIALGTYVERSNKDEH